jgi:hypothetical protein
MLRRLAIHRLFIAMAASPAPRKMPLIRNSRIITALPPNMIRVKDVPSATTSGSAPINRRISGAKMTPQTLIMAVTIIAISIVCIPA